jgi:hypothetical protein
MTQNDVPNPLTLAPIALITAAFLTVAVLAIATVAKWSHPWAIAAFSFAVIGAVSWVILLGWWRRIVEGIHGLDNAPMEIYPVETKLSLSVDWDEGRAGLFDDLDISDALFIEWACGVARGKSLGENHWTGAHNPFSKGQYHAFLDRMVFHGIIRQKGKARTTGYTLTGKGRAITSEVLRRYGDQGNHSPNMIGFLSNGQN